MSRRRPLALLPGFAVLAALAMPAAVVVPALAADAPDAKPGPVAQQVLSVMDRSADPCQDFYRYACGGWLANTQRPADQPIWGRGFSEIFERNRQAMRTILETAAKSPGSADEKKIGTFYASCLDEAAVDKAGVAPLKPWLEKIAGVKDNASLMGTLGTLHTIDVPAFFGLGVYEDFKDPSIDIAHFQQGGLGLPDRDNYLVDEGGKKELREKYVAHVGRMLKLLGESEADAKKHADAILALETSLARSSTPRAELRDPEKTYNRIERAGLQKLTPGLPWDGYFSAGGAPKATQLSVATPDFYKALPAAIDAAGWDTVRAYLRFHLARATAGVLAKPVYDEYFDFYARTLAGQQEPQARWKRCSSATDNALGEVLGRIYVDKHFPGDSKKVAVEMIRRVEGAFEAGLPQLSWMDDETRARAVAKVKTLVNKIGYPDKWIDYGKLEVKSGDWFGNAMRARQFESARQVAKIGNKVDKAEWEMTPPTVNAYYNPLQNEMVFPAGILQPPFFDKDFPAAMNFGGIGMVMGHELSHGFDDEGRKFDPQGKLAEWWAPAVSAKFEQQAKCIENLYGSYEVQPGLKLKGDLTLGENIADFGGIKSSFAAFKQWQKDNPGVKANVPGLTEDQLFFVGFAQTWCTLASPEIERVRLDTDPHSPPRYRVNGPVSNLPAFAEAFQCKEGSAMRPTNICTVW